MRRLISLIGILVLRSGVASNTIVDDDDSSVWDGYTIHSNYKEFITTESERGLFPSIFNLATNSLITATATCGQYRSEEYCKLVEHVLLRKTTNSQSPQCDICDANNVHKRHPIEYAIDGTRRWWQSPSLANGLEFEKVNITIDLRQEYQVAYVIVKMGNAPRPGTWVLEKSLDGENYEPWQYFAMQDAECMRQFGIPATAGVPRFKNDNEVHCTSEYSKITPLENGEIHTSLVNGRPGAENSSVELQKFTRARFVRLRLISPRTLNADLMVINRKSHMLDKSVTMRYFYSISDISIGGQCICYGHAESCPSDPVTGQFKCECRHNTCGESCNKCCPLFNQLPWKPGTNSHPNVCQQCQCFDHANSCVYDEELDINKWSITPEGVYEGGGRCVDCEHNTEGFNCERCKEGYYRPSGMSHYRHDACRTCDCDPIGSVSDACVRDDQTAMNGQQPGDCVCKPGFGGRRCDRCARGFRNHPTCEPCPCNQAGSVNFDTCDGASCQCKANVEGLYCDRCKPGTIHLSALNPLGCQSCFCFGLSNNCTQVEWNTAQISNNVGWNLTDLTGGKDVRPDVENGEVLMFNANQNQDRSLYYWKAPEAFQGNMLNSYGGFLHYYVYYVPTEQTAAAVPVADVVIEGNGVKVEYYSRLEFLPRENMTVSIAIREGNGWYNSATRQPVDKADLMRALAHVEKFLIRAMYQQMQLQSSIFGLSLDTAVPTPEGEVHSDENGLSPYHSMMKGVEVCECPENFAGNSCESCATGYRRVNDQLYGGRCEKCNCEGHSDECDPFTGECLNCQHNTTGTRCEKCKKGYYGNPSLGGELGACWPCECPTSANNRSPECMMTELIVAGAAAANEDDYVCTACEKGYEGNKCEVCSDGYFGDPMAENGTCVECDCNGNIDLMAIGNCDTETGKCLKCIGHTTGDHCEVCKENHYGNALQHTCKPCGCHTQGAVNPQCDAIEGNCECKENYIGKQCDRCKENHGDVDNGCPACDCDTTGSIGSDCDQVSGQCNCKQGVFGKHCDQCRPSYFNFTDAGCQFCHCNIYGSIEDGKCDNVTGECECRENVEGTMCEKCAEGFFNISSGNGCEDCRCDPLGAEGVACNLMTGQCVCKPGVTGLKCDKCAPNFFGLADEGCTECEPCPAPGQVCDPIDGSCVCPPNTVGEMCENCTTDAWDYHPLNGCRLCECSDVGSDGGKCDTVSGQCKCKEGYVGLKCDRCTHGFFNFPTCEPCACNAAGTDPLQCKDGLCLCNENGECPCKKNVNGVKCDACAPGTFSLESANLKGCTECFCFNRTTTCKQAPLFWQQMYAEDRRAVFQEPWEFYTKRHNINMLKESPSHFNSYPTDATPLYWPLPPSMLGDRTSSYNGFLRFKIWNEDNRRGIRGIRPDQQYFRYFPQVVIVGNNRIELEHIPMEINDDGIYKIRIHESEWRARHSPELKMSRKQMMVALQHVQGIYIRGSYNYPARGDAINLQEVSLDVAVPETALVTGITASKAIGIEQCSNCPQGYIGMSCQNPAEGYYRKKNRNYLNEADDLALIGWSEPCSCHGHSETCHPDTGVCLDCEHNTFGDFCEHCLPGYIGDAREGGANACTKCACPLIDNSFSDSCVAVDYGRGYVCNACRPGYTGQYCETCVAGYFGDAQHVGGFCAPCDCHPDGSLHGACNPLTGQCECKPGVTGRDCSVCQERHAFINRVCTSCDQGCYLPLMTTMDEMEEHLAAQNFTNLKPIPWKRVWRIGNETDELSAFVSSIDKNGEIVPDSKWAKEALGVVDEINFQAGRANKSAVSIKQFTEIAEQLILDAQIHYANAFNTTNFLRMFAEHGATTVGGAALDGMLMEAEAHWNATIERGEYIEKRFIRADEEHKKSQELLKNVFAKKLNETIFEDLKNRIDAFEKWLNDYRETIYDQAKKDTADAERISSVVSKRIDRYKEVSNEIEKLRVEAEDQLAYAKNAVEKAKAEELMNMIEDREKINTTLSEIPEMIEQCQNITLLYAQLIDEYDEEYVQKANKHVEQLEKEANAIGDSFAHTRLVAENPLKASHAYEEIIEALRNASKAANDAVEASNAAYDLLGSVDDEESDDNLMKKLSTISNQSEAISGDVSATLKIWNDENLEAKNKELIDRLSYVNEQKIDMIKRLAVIKNEASSWDDKHDRMHSVLTNGARTAHERAAAVKKEAEAIKEEIAAISEESDKLRNSTSGLIRRQIDEIKKARQDLEYGKTRLGKVEATTITNQVRSDDMAQRIAFIRDKIEQAREKANQIRLSINSGERGLCKRSFVSPARRSPVNTFHIVYRPLQRVADSAILVTKTKSRRTQSSEYVAVEVRDKRVVVHWNIGNGKKMATNSHPINYIPSNDRVTWYHIDVVRVGNSINVTVGLKENADGGFRSRGTPISVFVDGGDSDSVIFNTIRGETTLDVGTENETAAEIGLATEKFSGTIGGLKVDDVPLSLWAFEKTTPECEGAIAPPKVTQRGHSFKDGFANITMSVSERTMSAITIVFNAYSANGLLYFRGSEQSGDFVAVFLKDGRVVFKINLGGSSSAELTSQNVYNDGKSHTIKAIRTGSEMYLQVDSDADRFNTVISGQNTALNVDNEQHYVAGVPNTLNREPFAAHHIQWSGFVGCITTVKPSQIGELDLDHPESSQRQEPGCIYHGDQVVPNERVIGFSKAGYLKMRGIRMEKDSTFGFSFRTREENGTLIYQSSELSGVSKRDSENTKGYMAFYLFRGYLVLHFGKDASSRNLVVTFRSTQAYNDGQVHAVFMVRSGSSIRLKVDDKDVGEAQTLSDESPVSASVLLIGGFSDDLTPPNNEIPITAPFIGCVSDVFHNMKHIELIPISHNNAQIGVCSISERLNSAPMVDDMLDGEGQKVHRKASKISFSPNRNYYDVVPPTASHLVSASTKPAEDRNTVREQRKMKTRPDGVGAVRFGISRSSHSRVNFETPYPNVTHLGISLSLKTDESNGMVWAWANYKNYTRYIFFNIIDGFATLEVKGHKQPKILKHLGRRINDGQWHDVVIRKNGKSLTLKIDELESVEMLDCPTPKVMKRRMYVGGVISKHKSQFGLKTPGFDGCVRDLTVNDIRYELGGAASRDVITCAKPTKGAYVHEGGYAVFDGIQKLTRDTKIDIQLDFRPISSDGLLLALISNSNMDSGRLTLVVQPDKILVTLVHDESQFELRDAIPSLKPFCDSDWHTLQMILEDDSLVFVIDGERSELSLNGGLNSNARELLANIPLHLGGVSGPVAEKLSTRSLSGCLRNLHVSGKPKYFENSLKLNKVVIDGCPMH
ncbi:unnamed protein product [Caenorhabditis bovis]|uniref:Uncharacterized protein n=1 Tax=Caenorhabditis bovis TaxID=2654633 RepID=A0A8S1FAY6_9PELO|nr:unnamed protein product [Caenorhabditis bovis]